MYNSLLSSLSLARTTLINATKQMIERSYIRLCEHSLSLLPLGRFEDDLTAAKWFAACADRNYGLPIGRRAGKVAAHISLLSDIEILPQLENRELAHIIHAIPKYQAASLISRRNSQGETRLHESARSGDNKAVKAFCDALSMDEKDMIIMRAGYNGTTALFDSLSLGHIEVTQSLLEALSAGVKNEAIIQAHGVMRETALNFAAQNGYFEVVESLLEALSAGVRDEYIKQPNYNGTTALFSAAEMGHLEIVESLLEALSEGERDGAIKQARNDGATALYIATQNGHLEVVKGLLEALSEGKRNEYIKQAKNDGVTPIMMAAHEGHLEVAQTLISPMSEGARDEIIMQACPASGATAFMAAAFKGKNELVQTFLKALSGDTAREQAILHLCNDGKSALDYAASRGDTETLDMFLNQSAVKAHFLEGERAVALQRQAIDAGKKANAIYIARLMTANDLNPNEVEGMPAIFEEYRQEMAASAPLFEAITRYTGLPVELSEMIMASNPGKANTLTPGCAEHISLQYEHNIQPDKHAAPILFCGPGAQEAQSEQAEAAPQRARPA